MTHYTRASSTVRLFGLFGKVQNICSIYITEGFSYLKLFSPTLLTIHLCISKHTVIQGNSIFFIWCVLTLRGRKQFHSKSLRCMRVIIAVLKFSSSMRRSENKAWKTPSKSCNNANSFIYCLCEYNSQTIRGWVYIRTYRLKGMNSFRILKIKKK